MQEMTLVACHGGCWRSANAMFCSIVGGGADESRILDGIETPMKLVLVVIGNRSEGDDGREGAKSMSKSLESDETLAEDWVPIIMKRPVGVYVRTRLV